MKARKSFLLRLDPGLHATLERWAASEMRSLNGQIEYLLREAVVKRFHPSELAVESSPVEAADANPLPPAVGGDAPVG